MSSEKTAPSRDQRYASVPAVRVRPGLLKVALIRLVRGVSAKHADSEFESR